jgi:hypothetical protein
MTVAEARVTWNDDFIKIRFPREKMDPERPDREGCTKE